MNFIFHYLLWVSIWLKLLHNFFVLSGGFSGQFQFFFGFVLFFSHFGLSHIVQHIYWRGKIYNIFERQNHSQQHLHCLILPEKVGVLFHYWSFVGVICFIALAFFSVSQRIPYGSEDNGHI